MRPAIYAALLVLLSLLVGVGEAEGAPAPSVRCEETAAGAVTLHAVVLIDRTFAPSPRVREWVEDNVKTLSLIDGAVIQIGGFSNASGVLGATLDKPLLRPRAPDAAWVRTHTRLETARVQNCRSASITRMQSEIDSALKRTLGAEVKTALRSDIAPSLSAVTLAFEVTGAPRKLLILVGDGLECTAEQNFYSGRKPRLIDPAAEFEVFKKRDIPGSLGGAQVIWAGIGSSQVQLEWTAQRALTRYWLTVVRSMGGEPVEFAADPTLTVQQVLQRPPASEIRLVRAREVVQ